MLLKCYAEDKKTGATKHQHRQILFGQELRYYWHGPNNHPFCQKVLEDVNAPFYLAGNIFL